MTLKKLEDKLEEVLRRKKRPKDDDDEIVWTPAVVKPKPKPVKRTIVRPDDLSLSQQLQAKMVGEIKNEEEEEIKGDDGSPKKKEVSVWDSNRQKAQKRPVNEKSIFEQSEFPDLQTEEPTVKAPPKAPRRKAVPSEEKTEVSRKAVPCAKPPTEVSSSDESPSVKSDTPRIEVVEAEPKPKDEPQKPRREVEAKPKPRAESQKPAKPKAKQPSEKKKKEDLEEWDAPESKKKKKAGVNPLLNYFHRTYKESFCGSGKVEMLHASPLGLGGRWTSVIHLGWSPPWRKDSELQLTQRVVQNTRILWPRYLEMLLFLYFAMALPSFGILPILLVAQSAVLSRIKWIPSRVLELTHYVIWLLFFRSFLMMHDALKCLFAITFFSHVVLFS